MATRAEWEKPLDDLRARLAPLADMPSGDERNAALAAAFGPAAGWTREQKIFTLDGVGRRDAIDSARAGAIQWWEALASATYFGRLDDLRILHAALEQDPGNGSKPDLSTIMTWGAWNSSIAEDVPPAGNPGVLNQLFDWGADPMFKAYNGGTYFDKALRGSRSGIIQAFLAHGAPPATAAQVRDQLLQNGDYSQAREIQSALGFGGFYAKVDDAAVMETKYVTDAGRGCVLRTVFNFGAQRVHEVFEAAGSAPAMTGCSFADYSRSAIDLARAALEKLGGKPGFEIPLSDKPRRPGLGR